MKKHTIFLIILIILIEQIGKVSSQYADSSPVSFTFIDEMTDQLAGFGQTVSVSNDVMIVGSPYFGVLIYRFDGITFVLEQSINELSIQFGYNVALDEEVFVVSAYDTHEIFIYRYNGSYWDFEANFSENVDGYGNDVSISGNVIVVSSYNNQQIFIYRYDGNNWFFEDDFFEPTPGYGNCVAVSGDVIVVCAYDSTQVFTYRYSNLIWVFEQNIVESNGFGYCAAIENNLMLIGSFDNDTVQVYRYYNGNWNYNDYIEVTPLPQENQIQNQNQNQNSNQNQNQNSNQNSNQNQNQIQIQIQNQNSNQNQNQNQIQKSNSKSNSNSKLGIFQFGSSVSISGDIIAIGQNSITAIYLYQYYSNDWHLQYANTSLCSPAPVSVSISRNIGVLGVGNCMEVDVYTAFPPTINLINCSSLYSSFECYWNKIDYPFPVEYQIDYGIGWQIMEEPIILEGNISYQIFNSSYPNITGNANYSIIIKACEPVSKLCGTQSSQVDLTTRIPVVQNLTFVSTNNSINVTWNPPNVTMDGEIPDLDHYLITYYQDNELSITNITVDNTTTSFEMTSLDCGTTYHFSIYACRTLECLADDMGQVFETTIETVFDEVYLLQCSMLYVLVVSCSWISPITCSNNATSYIFSYQSSSGTDSGSFLVNGTSTTFLAKIEDENYNVQVSACNRDLNCGEVTLSSSKSGLEPSQTTKNLMITSAIFLIFGFVFLIGSFIFVRIRFPF
ncbi:hypothetical protein M0811_13161 [Anaeramoeba ignava]|uniref:Fibronectin type-III domain-containing protein n=1 Tax=Anaeramoeba ignava TaxID=1746090 RepID=A0A9Q0L6Y1_ANAIG|nr:hypothetical protein M0811_13161 [Anaeramoeba ignava]